MKLDTINILVVEDNPTDRIMMLNAISHTGIHNNICVAESIEEGLVQASITNFDCIFLDYYFPQQNGIDFIRGYFQNNGKGSIIMVTSQDDVNMAVECMKMGASDYITKNQITSASVRKSLSYVLKLKEAKEIAERAENALMESEFKLKSIIARSPVILFNINDSGIITLFKGKAASCLNLRSESIIGQNITELAGMTPINYSEYTLACKGIELHFKTKINGHYFDVHYIPVKDEHKNLTGMMGVAIDVTTFRKTEEELIHTILTKETTAKIQEEFLANMSHEIRTPIHGIISLSQFILDSSLTSEQSKQLGLIKKSAETLLLIVNDILDLSKIDADKMLFEQIRFNVQDTLQATIAAFIPKTIEKNIQLKTEFDATIPSEIKGDPVRLIQIFNNLLGNAIKFTETGNVIIGGKVIKQENEDITLEFFIKDTGIGIPADKIESIFESFTQALEDTSRKFGGTGLGLSITKKLIEKQQGSIKVTSLLGSGSCFTFSIPYKIANEEIKTDITEMKSIPEFDRTLNILVAEDNDINRFIIEKMLIDWGMNVDFAATGIEAMAKVNEKIYDIILMDVEMPDMNGYRTTELIRNETQLSIAKIPIIAMTGHAMAGEREKCLACGMDDYISKPFTKEALKEIIILNVGKATTANLTVKNNLITDSMSTEDIQCSQLKTRQMESGKTIDNQTNIELVKLVDLTFLKEISENNDQFFKEFITMFLQNTPISIQEMNTAFQQNDWERLRQAAHKAKPSFNYVGLKELNHLTAKIEEYAKLGQNKIEIKSMLEKITTMSELAYRELENEIKISSLS